MGVYKRHVWWPAWVSRGVYPWHGVVVAGLWPIPRWALGSASLWVGGHTLRLLIVATGFGWFEMACCAAAAVLPFVGGGMVIAAIFRPAPPSEDRARAVPRPRVEAEV